MKDKHKPATTRVIRVSEDTINRLKAWSVPLEDTPDSAIRKILDEVEWLNRMHRSREVNQ